MELGQSRQLSGIEALPPLPLPTAPCVGRVTRWAGFLGRKIEVIKPATNELIGSDQFIELGKRDEMLLNR